MTNPINFQVKTYLSTSIRKLNQIMLKINVEQGRLLPLLVLLDDDFNVQLKFDNFSEVRNNLIKRDYKLVFSHDDNDNQIKIQRILGVDISQSMRNTRIVKCLAWEMLNGIAPFGNSLHFLYDYHIFPVELEASYDLDRYAEK